MEPWSRCANGGRYRDRTSDLCREGFPAIVGCVGYREIPLMLGPYRGLAALVPGDSVRRWRCTLVARRRSLAISAPTRPDADPQNPEESLERRGFLTGLCWSFLGGPR